MLTHRLSLALLWSLLLCADGLLSPASFRIPQLPELLSSIESVQTSIQSAVDQRASILETLTTQAGSNAEHLITSLSTLPQDLTQVNWFSLAEQVSANPSTLPIFTAINVLAVVLGVGQDNSLEKLGSPYPVGSTSYSKRAADQFFGNRPLFVFRRLLALAQITGSLQIKLIYDWRTGQLEKNEKERAKEALSLATRCGPTTIKLAQALSLRTDLIPEAYALELRQLQDAVPAFSSGRAYEIMRQEYKVSDLSQVFRKLSNEPVASASIGQVYKGELADGTQVAVKVQRPNILSEIALDLYLLRLITPLQVRISNAVNKLPTTQADIDLALSLVDEWGRGFIAEVDYQTEAQNTKLFSQAMQKRGLVSVCAPNVVENLTRSRIIVTEWVDGTRLDRDGSTDVPRLCAVAVNAYLTMLLDTGYVCRLAIITTPIPLSHHCSLLPLLLAFLPTGPFTATHIQETFCAQKMADCAS